MPRPCMRAVQHRNRCGERAAFAGPGWRQTAGGGVAAGGVVLDACARPQALNSRTRAAHIRIGEGLNAQNYNKPEMCNTTVIYAPVRVRAACGSGNGSRNGCAVA